jgi:DNA-binding response OmpR family regulator
MTVLLCIKKDFLLTSMEYRFRKNGWEMEVAHNLDEAVEKAKTINPILVFIDLQLPEYQGLDIVQRLRKEVCPNAPIIVGAPMKEKNLMLEGLRLGAEDFIIAPYRPDEMVLRVHHQLKPAKVAG